MIAAFFLHQRRRMDVHIIERRARVVNVIRMCGYAMPRLIALFDCSGNGQKGDDQARTSCNCDIVTKARNMNRALKAQIIVWLVRSINPPAKMGPEIAAREEAK